MSSKLRHPVRALREPFGTAGLIIACVALIAALAGGAYAASGALTAKQKKEVKKIAKQFAGKPGAPGATGPQGNPGPAGANGKDGANGTNGTNGVSPTGTAFAADKGGCTEGGIEFKGANTTFACNGVKGQTGFTTTLPAGKTETGVFSALGNSALADLPFNIPFPSGKVPTFNVIDKAGAAVIGSAANCPGELESPEATPGNLCLYVAEESEFKPEFTAPVLATEQGFAVVFSFNSLNGNIWGVWAATAPTS